MSNATSKPTPGELSAANLLMEVLQRVQTCPILAYSIGPKSGGDLWLRMVRTADELTGWENEVDQFRERFRPQGV